MRKFHQIYLKLTAFIIISLNCYNISAQLINHNTKYNINSFISNNTSENQFKPKPRFRKQRFGYNTVYGNFEAYYGHYISRRYVLNYDLLLQSGEKNALSGNIGVGYQQIVEDSCHKDEIVFPIRINVLVGSVNHLQLSLGGIYFKTSAKLFPIAGVGFRHQPAKGGFMYHIMFNIQLERAYSVTTGREISKTAVYGPAVGVGWSF